MDVLILILAIIIVFFRKHKSSILRSIKRYALKAAALALSIVLVMSLVITELTQRLLDRIGKEEQKAGGLAKSSKGLASDTSRGGKRLI